MKPLVKFFVHALFRLPVFEDLLVRRNTGRSPDGFWGRITPRNTDYNFRDVRAVKRSGIRYELNLSNYFEHSVYFGFAFPSQQELYSEVKDGDVIIDVGSGIGEDLLNMAKRNPGGHLYGFEPVESNFKKLQKNLSLNNFNNVQVFALAMSDTPERVYYTLQEKQKHTSGVFMHKELGDMMYAAATTTLDFFVEEQQIKDINLIRVDVEGFEEFFLEGAKETLRKFHPKMVFEINQAKLEQNGSSLKEIVEWLYANGYKAYDLFSRSEIRNFDREGNVSLFAV